MAALYDFEPNSVLNDLIPFVLSRVARDHRTLGSITTASKPSAALAALNVPIMRRVSGRLHSTTPVLLVLTTTRLPATLNDAAIMTFARRSPVRFCVTVQRGRESPRKLWRSVNHLLGRGRPPASSCITVDEFSRFFSKKVNAVRSSTDRARLKLAVIVHCVPMCSRHCTAVSV